ncbi:lipase family protein [Anaerolineales bacterium HSG6]|nr:lipase family protein [Anaerolineales bacterium HSG6]MDM8530417.1 lipase family protein [Anaerolineales bacterium HSG25]
MNKTEALLCAKISMSAYGKGYNIDSFQLAGRFENKATDTQGLFGTTDDTLFLAFRGSEETGATDWMTDLKFVSANYPYGGGSNVVVHAGFIEAYQSIRESIIEVAKDTPHKKITCTGHSLGGALATLCVLDLACNVPNKQVSSYTYGSPKVGGPDFVKLYNQKVPQSYRFVNGPDIVPTIPVDIPFLVDYDHVGKLHHIGNTQASKLSTDAVMSHLPKSYISAIEQA